ncbi:hypothetical protein DL96DRAFT_1706217 [Flagelloscypha sp. PMI_526]|nr:hypothetical protein DL96DRAFT_1706217 [Flagelloscypha sp. PMI_526]
MRDVCHRLRRGWTANRPILQTFFGGHTPDWASPTDQYAWFTDGMQDLDVDLLNLHKDVLFMQPYIQGICVARNVDGLFQDLALHPERILANMISGVTPSAQNLFHPQICPVNNLPFQREAI